AFPSLKVLLANYFDCFGENLEIALSLPVHTLHLDLVRCPSQLDDILNSGKLKANVKLSLGVVDGRNIWKNDLDQSLALIQKAKNAIGEERILIAPSCSLIHSPCDLDLENNEETLPTEIKQWLVFAKQKIEEVVILQKLIEKDTSFEVLEILKQNQEQVGNRKTSSLIHDEQVKNRVKSIAATDDQRKNRFAVRQSKQKTALNLPLFPTTTIGSFPQTTEVRSWRARFKKGDL